MDTSKEYILMCEKAEELQNDWRMTNGDYYYNQTQQRICISHPHSDGIGLKYRRVFIPRQDQLQEMVEGNLWSKVDNLKHELDMCVNRVENITLEKAWLFYAMRRKYDKTWNGKEWVKTQEGKS